MFASKIDHKKFGEKAKAAFEFSRFCHTFTTRRNHIVITMKKSEKPVESPSIRSYEHVVKRVLLNNLCFVLIFGLAQSSFASPSTTRPTFIVLDNDAAFDDSITAIRKAGGDVRQRIPPYIFVADIPTTVSVPSQVKSKYVFTSLLSPKSLEAYGPLAVAAAHQWNRQFVTQAQSAGAKSLSSMRVLVAQKSLPRVSDLQATIEGTTIRISWTGLEGARVYEVEAAHNASFTSRWLLTRSNTSSVTIAAPSGRAGAMYIRVRGIDHLEGSHQATEDIFGAWSGATSVNVPLLTVNADGNAPELASPQDNFETEGLTLILEWNDSETDLYRVQIARDDAFGDVLVDSISDSREFVVPSQALHVGDSLNWRVQKWGTEASAWSEIRRVRIGAPKHLQTDMFVDPSVPQ